MNKSGKHTLGHGEAQLAYFADVSAAGAAGITTKFIAAKYGVSRASVTQAMNKIGGVFCRRARVNQTGVWVLKRYATPTEAETMRKAFTIKPQSMRLDSASPVVMPMGGPKIMRAETPKDRFAFTPPPGWRGCIDSSESREWAKHAQR